MKVLHFVLINLLILLGTKSDGEAPASSEEESVSTDRGYTSDSELTRSPKHVASRPQSPIIVPVSYSGTPANAGGWILVR